MLINFRDVFANDETEVAHNHRIHLKINTGEHPPVASEVAMMLRRTPFALWDEVEQLSRVMGERGVICDSISLLLKKWIIPIFPLPSFRECLDSLGGSAKFNTLELHSGYWQIRIEPKEKTAFITATGHWEFIVMPFGVQK